MDYIMFYLEKKRVWMRIMFISMAVYLTLAGCGARDPEPYNPMGLPGKRSAEAETAYARAHALWDRNDVCSDPVLALELLNKAIRLEPGYAEAYVRRGLARSDLRDWDSAFDDLSRAIRLNPTAEAYAFRGLVSLRGGNYLGARKDLDKSLTITGRQYRAWNFRGVLNRQEGNQIQACKDFAAGCDRGDCNGLEMSRELGECPR